MASSRMFITRETAQNMEKELCDSGFTIDQTKELCGLSVSTGVYKTCSPDTHKRVLVVCGPGANGAIGLIAARHMWYFGYEVCIHYPKRPETEEMKRLHRNLERLCQQVNINFIDEWYSTEELSSKCDMVLDAIFGFNLTEQPSSPFDKILKTLSSTRVNIVSVDVPSGWDADKGDVYRIGLMPTMLISLGAPKACARQFRGRKHLLGGRFVPPTLTKKYGVELPKYRGCELVVDVPVSET